MLKYLVAKTRVASPIYFLTLGDYMILKYEIYCSISKGHVISWAMRVIWIPTNQCNYASFSEDLWKLLGHNTTVIMYIIWGSSVRFFHKDSTKETVWLWENSFLGCLCFHINIFSMVYYRFINLLSKLTYLWEKIISPHVDIELSQCNNVCHSLWQILRAFRMLACVNAVSGWQQFKLTTEFQHDIAVCT
jgi:hypothetical protein